MMGKMNTKHEDRVIHKLKAQVTHLVLFPFSLVIPSPEAARAGGGYSNRWGAEKHRNVSNSSQLQKYTRTKGHMKAQTETNP